MAQSITARWLTILAVVLIVDVVVWLAAGLVFVNENCEDSARFGCNDVVRDLARALLYATPVVTVAALFLALHAWGKRISSRRRYGGRDA